MHHRSFVVRAISTLAVTGAVAASITVGSMTSASAAKVYDGPDVASYQHPHPTKAHPHGQPINWKAVRKSGKDFAIVKATEGTNYVNPSFAGPYFHDYADAGAAKLVHGAYHFARPTFPIVSSAVAQARFFAAQLGSVKTRATLPPALDLEVNGGLGKAQLVTWAQTFLLKMRDLTGRTPMLYTYPTFWTGDLGDPLALARYPLWMASYGTPRAPIADLWQYTSTAHVKGIVGKVDLSKFVGTSGFPWQTLSDGTVHTPWPDSAPAAPVTPTASLDGTSALVRWLPGDSGTSRVTRYRVKESPGDTVQTVNGTHFSTTFDNLTPNTSYTFTVTAVNSVGRGAQSLPTNPVVPVIPTVLSAVVQPSLSFGQPAPVKTKLTRADTKAALAGKPLLVLRRNPTGSWRQIRTLSTNTSGRARVVLHPTHSAKLKVVFPGSKRVARSTAFTKYVVRPTVTAALSATSVPHGGSATLSGTASPFAARQKVTLESLVNGIWQAQATTKLDRQGAFSFTVRPKVAGDETLRALVAPGDRRGSGHSKRVHLTVT
jgi:GH25 family lysozyme M1 (1,4-beta-N-acetylmuramidase)